MPSEKGISSHRLGRILEIQYNSAWCLSHRIREVMRCGDLAPFGSGGGAVKLDGTYFGTKKGVEMGRGGYRHKMAVQALVDRNSGHMRTYDFDQINGEAVTAIVRANTSTEARLMTDEARVSARSLPSMARRFTPVVSTSITPTARSTRTPWKARSPSSSVA